MHKNSEIRVRFGPSLDDNFAILYVSPVLINWIFSKRNGGRFVYRIDDTNTSAVIDGAFEDFSKGMQWLGLDWDEGIDKEDSIYGPYFQKERASTYRQFADKLIESGNAYWCFCSPEEIESMRDEQKAKNQPTRYNRKCRHLTKEEVIQKGKDNKNPVLRFKTPLNDTLIFQDIIHGEQIVNSESIDDFIIQRSDGSPTYHLAVVVDDYLMKISHVIRDASFLVNTPLQILLHKALGIEYPNYIHYPRINVSDNYKPIYISELKEQGYVPESIVSYIADISFNLPEYFKKDGVVLIEKLAAQFSPDLISTSRVRKLNYGHLETMNKTLIKKVLSEEKLIDHIITYLHTFKPVIMKELNKEIILEILREKIRIFRIKMTNLGSIVDYLLVYIWKENDIEIELFKEELGLNNKDFIIFMKDFKNLLLSPEFKVNKEFLTLLGGKFNVDFQVVGRNLAKLLGHRDSNVSLALLVDILDSNELYSRVDALIDYSFLNEQIVTIGDK